MGSTLGAGLLDHGGLLATGDPALEERAPEGLRRLAARLRRNGLLILSWGSSVFAIGRKR